MNLISGFIVVILFLIGIVFIAWGIIEKLKNNHLLNKCVKKCEGTLIKINEIEIEHYRNSDSLITDRIKSYVPVYQYNIDGKLYRIKGTNGSGFKIGDVVIINYNPENPKESYIDGYSFVFWFIFIIIGLIFIIISLIILFLVRL